MTRTSTDDEFIITSPRVMTTIQRRALTEKRLLERAAFAVNRPGAYQGSGILHSNVSNERGVWNPLNSNEDATEMLQQLNRPVYHGEIDSREYRQHAVILAIFLSERRPDKSYLVSR